MLVIYNFVDIYFFKGLHMALMCVKNHPAKEYFGQQREREKGFGLKTCKAMKSCRWLSVEVQEAVHNYVFIYNKRRWDWNENVPISFQIRAVGLDTATQLDTDFEIRQTHPIHIVYNHHCVRMLIRRAEISVRQV